MPHEVDSGAVARLQRTIIALWLFTTTVWAFFMISTDRLGWALAGLCVAIGGHAVVLAIEFAVMSMVNRGDCLSSNASVGQVVRAWWAEARAAPRVFLWQQPFRSQAWPDDLSGCTGRRGVLLVHGFFCNRGFWNPWIQTFRRLGVPYAAVNLEPVFSSIDAYVGIIEQAMGEFERRGGHPPVVVAHSMGGMAVRRWLSEVKNHERVHRFITLGTPHHGTVLAQIGFASNVRQMRRRSEWRAELERAERSIDRSKTVCYFSHCDNIVFPASSATLAGADNRHLTGVAHVEMAESGAPLTEVLRLLER